MPLKKKSVNLFYAPYESYELSATIDESAGD